ncbi:MAG: DegV family protein [Chloroflexi bacterium]|nr:DegV family protein [Chloroflexota bacterium]
MPNVKILTDSLADIPPQVAQALDITSVPCIVRFGETEYRDRVDIFPTEFYQRLSTAATLPTTSQPATGVFEDIYRRLAQESDQILAIHTISSLSGVFNASRLAAENIPNVHIELIDSQQVTMSLGWLVILAARAAQQGARLPEIRAVVEAAMPRAHVLGMLNTLEYAQRGGRLGKGAALVGTLLNVKPLISIVNGEVVPVENVRTQKRALERLIEIVLGSGPIQELSVIHSAAPELAEKVKQQLAATFPEDQILMSETGPVLGTHVGPGAVGIAWLTGRY